MFRVTTLPGCTLTLAEATVHPTSAQEARTGVAAYSWVETGRKYTGGQQMRTKRTMRVVCACARQMTKLLEELHNSVLFYSERHLNMQVRRVYALPLI